MNILNIILYIFLGIEALAIIAYIPRMSMWFTGLKKQKRLINYNKSKLCVLLPVRNEGKTILPLLESIKKQTYDKTLFELHIITSGPEDTTIPFVKNFMENIVIHDDILGQTRKADALDGCVKKLFKDSNFNCDAFVIVDGDCILDERFLEEMNNALASGADVIIPRKSSKNWLSANKKNRNIISNCSYLTWPGLDAMGNKTKCKKGYTMAMCGQGMLIKKRVLDTLGGYPFKSLTEDFEVAIECMRKHYKQYYYEYAILYSEEPITNKEFNKRRMRWIQGFAQFNKKYGKEVKELTFKRGKIAKENLYFLYGIFPIYAMFAVAGVFFVGFLITALVLAFTGGPALTALLYALIAFLVAYFELFFYGVISLCEDKDVNQMTLWERIKLAVMYPIITFEYIYIFIFAFTVNCDGDWKPVERIEM